MAISKKIRFEIFKRDGFKCGYCGKTPPEVTLEVDHINPKANGGTDRMDNLITACFDCNRGKTKTSLSQVHEDLRGWSKIEKESAKEAYLKLTDEEKKQLLIAVEKYAESEQVKVGNMMPPSIFIATGEWQKWI